MTPVPTEEDPRRREELSRNTKGLPAGLRLRDPGDRWINVRVGRLRERFTSREIDRWMEVI
jgi:hypothetical protein